MTLTANSGFGSGTPRNNQYKGLGRRADTFRLAHEYRSAQQRRDSTNITKRLDTLQLNVEREGVLRWKHPFITKMGLSPPIEDTCPRHIFLGSISVGRLRTCVGISVQSGLYTRIRTDSCRSPAMTRVQVSESESESDWILESDSPNTGKHK